MKVFISWSGERSKAMAHALRDWLPLVLHYVQPWLSEADIEAGERWAQAVAKELDASNFGIICVTRDNLASAWVLFEAGALAKSLQDSRVIPLLFDLEFRDITGPLAQFQAKKVDKASLSEVVHSINAVAPHAVPEARAKDLFEALWSRFEEKLAGIPKQAPVAKHPRPQHEVLEELVAGVRALDSRIREPPSEGPRLRHRRQRFHPMMVREIASMIGSRSDDPIALLIYASFLREDAPWLYELGIEAYRANKAGSNDRSIRALQQFARAVELTAHGPFSIEELGGDPRSLHMISHELEKMMGRFSEPQHLEGSQKDQEPKPKVVRRTRKPPTDE